MSSTRENFSVLVPVYIRESAANLQVALRSIYHDQILKPSEIVIVEDGPVTDEVQQEIDLFSKSSGCKVIVVKNLKNQGLGIALQNGLECCSNDIVFRMDSDDISLPNRFLEQVDLINRKDCDVVGSSIAEFDDDENVVISYRDVPVGGENIRKYSYWRNPLNHPSVGFRKSRVMLVGGYRHMLCYEDYFLWLRMLHGGMKIENHPEPLVKMRGGLEQLKRRRGLRYAINESRFYLTIAKLGLLPLWVVIINIALKIPARFVPAGLLRYCYENVLRRS